MEMDEKSTKIIKCPGCNEDMAYNLLEAARLNWWEFLQCPNCYMNLGNPNEGTPIPEDVLGELCKLGSGPGTCSYIAATAGGWECLKHCGEQRIIDERREAGTMAAMGDNCEGMGVMIFN